MELKEDHLQLIQIGLTICIKILTKQIKIFILHYGDISDSISVKNLITKIKPDEIYNLAAQSHVGVSFQIPEYTANVDALGRIIKFRSN